MSPFRGLSGACLTNAPYPQPADGAIELPSPLRLPHLVLPEMVTQHPILVVVVEAKVHKVDGYQMLTRRGRAVPDFMLL